FAGTNLIITGATLLEITATTLVVNIRYILMSFSLSQKVAERITLPERCLLSFGITDETFTVASMHKEKITFSYMLGLITGPYWGWALGTLLGAMICSVLPETLQNSMGIALYAMFIALVVPNAKKSRAALAVVFIAVAISSAFTWVPYLHGISQGWGIILATIAACLVGAIFFPREEE
ncbi:MAG TPA: AzlC family ABC transporter permease, partial [Bacillota bacterium]